ncbi:MAG TPA: hypothetical protein VGX46_10360, partial [Vicinamibacterales bacterium]|nr:hypothetical protein [Vicinamibacterales bacterium]
MSVLCRPIATGIVVQLHRTQDLEIARSRLLALFRKHGLDLEVRDFRSMTVAFAPAVAHIRPIYSDTNLPSLDPSFGRTNARA